MKLCFIDAETTGTDPRKNGIIQIAGRMHIDGILMEPFNLLVRPLVSDEIDEKALAVSHTTRQAIEQDPYVTAPIQHRELMRRLSAFIDKFYSPDKAFFVGYNALFDYQFVRAWFEKLGDKYFGSWFWFPCIDVAVLAGVVLGEVRASMPDFKLGTVAAKLGLTVDPTKQHDAAYDIDLTIDVYNKCLERLSHGRDEQEAK